MRLLFALLALSFPLHAERSKPNIIVIFNDDQTYRGIGYHIPEVKTPHLDALAASGITSGRFPEQHGLRSLDTPAFAPNLTGAPYANQGPTG